MYVKSIAECSKTCIKLPSVLKIFVFSPINCRKTRLNLVCSTLRLESKSRDKYHNRAISIKIARPGSYRVSGDIYRGEGAQWLSGRVLDSRPRGRGFEPHQRHLVVSLSMNINLSLVLVQPWKTRPFIAERFVCLVLTTHQPLWVMSVRRY